MADIALTAAKIGRAHPDTDEVFPAIAGAAITAGQVVYFNTTTGKLAVADGSAAGTAQVRGIALNAAAAGEPVTVLKRGFIEGFTLAGDYDSAAYLSDTAGALADAAGTVAVTVGRVARLGQKKVLYVDCDWRTAFSA